MKEETLSLGVDLGSRNVKLTTMKNNQILYTETIETIHFYKNYGIRSENGLNIDLNRLSIAVSPRIVATGYGRSAIHIKEAVTISEIKAHYLGAKYQSGLETFTLLDVGGQDFKVIKVVEGDMADFSTNDKCAASTGRYLENISKVLDMSIEKLGEFDEDPINISSTCAIFAESEVIGMIVMGTPIERIAAGVNRSIVERLLPSIEAMNTDPIVFAGGMAHNNAVTNMLKRETGKDVIVLDSPLYNGAIGCCMYS